MSFLRNAWYVAMWAQELRSEQLAPRTMLGEPLVLFRNREGAVRALLDICPHRHAPLHLGRIQSNGAVQCGYHALQFDEHGECVHNPHGNGHIPPGCRVRSYPVVEKHSIIWVWMGNDEADISRIPDYAFLDATTSDVASKRDSLAMKANYRLVVDNLLDLSHVPFLHEGLLGNASTIRAEMKIEQHGDELFVSRDKFNATPPGLLDKLFKDDGAPVDAWQTIRWTLPSNLRNESGVYPVNGRREDGAGIVSAHLLTPIDEFNTMYHFAAVRRGVPLSPERDADELARLLSDMRRHAFEFQDEPMIEAQQATIHQYPQFTKKQILLQSDAGVVRANRMLDEAIAKEPAKRD